MMLTFSQVVGQESAKLALLLSAVQPLLGGVLLRGDKGSAKTTLARGLAAILPGNAPFVELPLGAEEDRVLGSLDLAALLQDGRPSFRPGLLAAAHGGVLYVDEINLLADHLVDSLLDVAVTGVNRVERDGMSHTHPARFVLIGSMNPEEGELRPQLLDRFGLSVEVTAPPNPIIRAQIVRAQIDAESNAHTAPDQTDLQAEIDAARTRRPILPDTLIQLASHLAVAVGAEGMRADLMLSRAAMAHAAWRNAGEVADSDLESVAPFVLSHRRRRRPFDPPSLSDAELDRAWKDARDAQGSQQQHPRQEQLDPAEPSTDGEQPAGKSSDASPDENGIGRAPDDRYDAPGGNASIDVPVRSSSQPPRREGGTVGHGDTAPNSRGRTIRSTPWDGQSAPDARASATVLATRRATSASSSASATAADLRSVQRVDTVGTLTVLVVDASSSMGVQHRMAATKQAVLGLLGDAYVRRDRVALITFAGDTADLVLRPTASIELARARLSDIRTGGTSPLAAGLAAAHRLIHSSSGDRPSAVRVVIVTDGRATDTSADPVGNASQQLQNLCRSGADVIVADTESGPTRLGLARQLAEQAGAGYATVDASLSDLDGVLRF